MDGDDNILFFKFHKVGGSTLKSMLAAALPDYHKVDGDEQHACLAHSEGLPLMKLFRDDSVLEARPAERVAAMYALDERTMLRACPLPRGVPLRTVVLMRRPIERIISKYFFQQGGANGEGCNVTRAKGGEVASSGTVCAAQVLQIDEWLRVGAEYVVRDRSGSWVSYDGAGPDRSVQCEPLSYMGGEGCTQRSLAHARKVPGRWSTR